MISFLLFLSGLAIGSFLNVVIDRLPKGQDIVFGRSRCDYCRKTLRWFELVPLLSWLLLKGRCRRCRRRLSLQYPLVELMTGLAFMLVSIHHSVFWFVIVSAAIVIVVTDFKYQVIPDSMLALLLISSLIVRVPMTIHGLVVYGATGIISGSLFYLLRLITRGRGMGFGDVKLSAVLGAIFGFPQAVIAFYAAFLTGSAYGVILMMLGKAAMKSRVAFGPFLLLGAGIALFWSEPILHWWGFL